MKMPLKFFSYLIIIINFLQTCCGKHHRYCPPSACGNIRNISYPFRLRDDPKHCGDSHYELACENNTTFTYLYSQKYFVQAINYHNYTIRLTYPTIITNDSCSFPNYSLPLDNFYYGFPYSFRSHKGGPYKPDRPKITRSITFMSCPSYVVNHNSLLLETTDCFDESDGRRRTYVKFGHLNGSDIMDKCKIEVMAMTSLSIKEENGSFSLSEIHSSLLYGFELSWFSINCGINCSNCWLEGTRARCGIQILSRGMNAEALSRMLGAQGPAADPQQPQTQQNRPPRARVNRRAAGRGQGQARGGAGNEVPPRGPIEDLTLEGTHEATPPPAAPVGPISLSSNGSRNRSGEPIRIHEILRADRQGKRKRMPDSLPISGKGKEVVVGHRGEGSDTSSSEDEVFWKIGCKGDSRYKRQRTEGPVLLKKSAYSINLVSDIVGKLQFSGDHDKLNNHDAARVADDACHVLLTEVIPRLKNLQGRAQAYSEHKAKYKKLLRVSDPVQLQEDYNNLHAQLTAAQRDLDQARENLRKTDEAYLALDERQKKLKEERDQLRAQNAELGGQLAESTRQNEVANKAFADLQGKIQGLEAKVSWEAVKKFVRSKAFVFAANIQCFDNARRFFHKAIGQMVKFGLAPESARSDARLRMDLDENGEPMVQEEDPSESLAEPEYQELVETLQREFIAANRRDPEPLLIEDEGTLMDVADADEPGEDHTSDANVLAPVPLATAPPEPDAPAH